MYQSEQWTPFWFIHAKSFVWQSWPARTPSSSCTIIQAANRHRPTRIKKSPAILFEPANCSKLKCWTMWSLAMAIAHRFGNWAGCMRKSARHQPRLTDKNHQTYLTRKRKARSNNQHEPAGRMCREQPALTSAPASGNIRLLVRAFKRKCVWLPSAARRRHCAPVPFPPSLHLRFISSAAAR